MRYVDSLNQALHRLMCDDERVIVLGQDILDPYGGAFRVTRGLSSAYPDRVLTTPISEAGITGFAIGMALRGYRPVLEIMFGDFLTLCVDQIVNGASKFSWMYNGQVTVPVVIRTPMGGRRGYGPTHSQSLESLFLGVPGLTIIAPSHCHDPGALLAQSVSSNLGPVLFIENKQLYPISLKRPHTGRVDDFYVRESHGNTPTVSLCLDGAWHPDVTLVTYGGMAPLALEAARNVFLQNEIVVEVVLPSLVKPLPMEDILPSARASGHVVVAEEGWRTAGWGAELACRIHEAVSLIQNVSRVGTRDLPIPSAISLETQVLPQVTDIEVAIRGQVETRL